MKLILSDVDSACLQIGGEHRVIEPSDKLRHCVGCFRCWVKTPGQCVILDGFQDMGKQLSLCDELILVSECVYGSTSPSIKNMMDRALAYIHPNFCDRNGEMHHRRRYANKITLTAYFYGESITEQEKETARKLMRATAVNYDGAVGQIVFLEHKDDLRGMTL